MACSTVLTQYCAILLSLLDFRCQGVKHVQENVPAPRRGSRKRGAAAQTLETVAEEEQPEDEAKPEETGAEDVQDIDIVGDAEAAPVAKPKGKPPLPGKPQRGRAAKKEEAHTGECSVGRCAHTCHVPNLLVCDNSLSEASCGACEGVNMLWNLNNMKVCICVNIVPA